MSGDEGDHVWPPMHKREVEESAETDWPPTEEDQAWNDEDEDQAWSDGSMDDQVEQWRSDGIDEEEIRGRAGKYYKPPRTPRLAPLLALAHVQDPEPPEPDPDLAYLIQAIKDTWGDYDTLLPGAQAALRMLEGKVAEDGSEKQQKYLGDLAGRVIRARTELVAVTSLARTPEMQLLMRAGFAWVVLTQRNTTQAGATLSAILGGPGCRHTHAALDAPYGVADSVLSAAAMIDRRALSPDALLWLQAVQEAQPRLRRNFRDVGLDPSDYDPYMSLPSRKYKRPPKPKSAKKPKNPRSTI